MRKVLLLYVPVLHAGYLKIFEQYRGVDAFWILGAAFINELSSFHKEIRAIAPPVIKKLIESLGLFRSVAVLEKGELPAWEGGEIVTANEEVCRKFIAAYFPQASVTYANVFLRWDEKNVKSDVKVAHDRISEDPLDQEMVARAAAEAENSSDWWRHVGAVAVKDGKIIFESHNQHVPSEHMPYAMGDPRDVIEPGTMNLLYTSIHAEQDIVARAAAEGISLQGASIYMNIFPCPLCAKLIAYSGIKKCFFKTGSAWLDAESILKARGVEIILVK